MTASGVRLLVLDVDGVMTDGSIVYDDNGRELKFFFVRDGLAINEWRRLGHRVGIITARGGGAVERRAAELHVDSLLQGASDKGEALRQTAQRLDVRLAQTAYLGDDLTDLPAMRLAGHPMAVADAEQRVKAAARFITPRPGGRGAVRDAVEHLLEARGELAALFQRYDVGHDA